MFKIKSHNRYRSQQISSSYTSKNEQKQNSKKIKDLNVVQQNQTKSHFLKKLPNTSKNIQLKNLQLFKIKQQSINTLRNPINSCRQRFNHNQIKKLQFSLKQQQLQIQKVQDQISKIMRKQVQETQKTKILNQLINIMQIQFNSQQKKEIPIRIQNDINTSQNFRKDQNFISKLLIQINKNIDQNKRLAEEILKQRKLRVLYENYLNKLQRQIKTAQNQYNSLLFATLQNKFFVLMISSNDIISNGHVVALKKQNTQEMQKQLDRNTYMCLPKVQSTKQDQEDVNFKRKKSEKFIGKKGTIKKLNKIIGLMESSKAFQSSQLSLYQNDQQHSVNSHKSMFSIFKTQRTVQRDDFNNSEYRKHNRKNGKKCTKKLQQRSGKIVSIKYLMNMHLYYEGNIDQIVYELFRIYQSLGINIFSNFINKQNNNSPKKQNYFQYDQNKLVEQIDMRLQFVKENYQRMSKFNNTLQSKIKNIQKNINQTQNLIQQNKKYIDQKKNKYIELNQNQKQFNSNDVTSKNQKQIQSSQKKQQQQQFQLFKQISSILGIKYQNYDSFMEIENKIEKINSILWFQEKQSPNSSMTNIRQDANTHVNTITNTNLSSKSKSNYKFETRSEFIVENMNRDNNQIEQKIGDRQKYQKRSYTKQLTKTQGCQRKFHQLIINKDNDDQNPGKIFQKMETMNQSCRSVFQNGKKSLDNIFQNLKICNSYQKAFQRSQFQKEYSKQITKKKRVMFRRQAKFMPTQKLIKYQQA